MVKNKISPQQKWNRKHRNVLRKASRKYYYKNRKKIIKHKILYRRHKRLERRNEQRKKANV